MPTLTDPAVLTLARHFADMGGWLHATYFGRDSERDALNALLANELVVEGWRGRSATYELTTKGGVWLAWQETS